MESKITVGLKEALAHAKKFGPYKRFVWKPPTPSEILKLRQLLCLTQREFSERFEFDLVILSDLELVAPRT